MSISSWNSSTITYLQNAPVKVTMAGFESDTLRLQNAGWQMSIESFQLYDRAAQETRVAFKHDGIKQVAIARMIHNFSEIYRRIHERHFNLLETSVIEISCIAPLIKCHIMPLTTGFDFSMNAIDARPQWVEKDLNEIAVFKPIKAGEDFEIYINQKDEAEILELLLKKQDPKQKEIRQNMKRRTYQNGNEGLAISDLSDKVNTDIRHQLMLVS